MASFALARTCVLVVVGGTGVLVGVGVLDGGIGVSVAVGVLLGGTGVSVGVGVSVAPLPALAAVLPSLSVSL